MVITKFRIDGKIGNMLWKSGPILMYQFMWYTPGMGKGAARSYIGTICFPSTPTQGRMRRMHLWQEFRVMTLQLQCHLWAVCLLMQDHLGQSHQAQQVAHSKVVWISLLCLDAVCRKPRNDFNGGTRIPACRNIPVHPASGMHELVCVSVSISYSVLHCFLEEYSVDYTLHAPSCVCQALLSFGIEGNSFNVFSTVDLWMVGEWTKGYLAHAQLPHCEYKIPNGVPIET